ncbi:MAG TPA: FAD-dependent oxidoreductase [Amycolatopsis sp.]|nr:FAD-dependent oxidoreductase [Amycolatopsis sp.]
MPDFRVAVVGSGPAGLYAADELVRQQELDVEVDIFDRLPTPYGLVRYGVAPDHARIKTVVRSLRRILEHARVRYLGNVHLGSDIDRAFLEENYDATVYATGASRDRRLDVPGEDLRGVCSATQLVSWYSAHPDARGGFDPAAESVAVIGAGNVALDVARILVKTRDELARHTDMPSHVLDQLGASAVREVHVFCRRGPEHAKFTAKELRELGDLPAVDVVLDPAVLARADAAAADKQARANLAAFEDLAKRTRRADTRKIRFHFWSKPVGILGDGAVEALRVEHTAVDADGSLRGTGECATVAVQLVVRSVGYRSVPVPDLPFDDRQGTVPHDRGRIVDPAGAIVPRQYVAGWLKRGPSGVIGTNRIDSAETVRSLVEDLKTAAVARKGVAAETIDMLLAGRGVRPVHYDGWLRIDSDEIARGRRSSRERTKIPDWETLLQLGLAARSG